MRSLDRRTMLGGATALPIILAAASSAAEVRQIAPAIVGEPKGPAPVTALIYARVLLAAARTPDGSVTLSATDADALFRVIERPVRQHWGDGCMDALRGWNERDCGGCMECGGWRQVAPDPALDWIEQEGPHGDYHGMCAACSTKPAPKWWEKEPRHA